MNLPLHVEVVQKQQSNADKAYIKNIVQRFVSNLTFVTPGTSVPPRELQRQKELCQHVSAITFCDVEHARDVAPAAVDLRYDVHRLDEKGVRRNSMTDGASEQQSVAEVWALPARELHGLWESLVFDSSLKSDLVRFVETALLLEARGVDARVVISGRVLLLHGPPGSGKTSLCRALAHKLSVRLAESFPRALLVDVKAHALYSRWFCESGKRVASEFARVRSAAADPRALVCVLLDEVESLAHARRASAAGLEPSDAVRAVNALLTQLDWLRRLPNVLVLATTNMPGAVDVALADRADIKRRVGPPGPRAAYNILRGCCLELVARGAVTGGIVFALNVLEGMCFQENAVMADSLRLWAAASAAAARQISARALRRLPMQAYARLPHLPQPALPVFLAALEAQVAAVNAFCTGDADFDALQVPTNL